MATRAKAKAAPASSRVKAKAKATPASGPAVTLTQTVRPQSREEKRSVKIAEFEKKAVQIEKLCMLGATDAEVAAFFDVSDQVLNRWRVQSELIAKALKIGKVPSDQRVERSLFDRAVGCERPMIKIFFNPRTGQVVEHHYMEKYPPDPLSCIFWLKNRKPDSWRERYDAPPVDPQEAAVLAQEVLARAMGSES
jgi:hypothetical protein